MLLVLHHSNGCLELKNASKHYKSELCPEDLHSLLSDPLAFEIVYLQLLTVCILYGNLGILQPGWKGGKIRVQIL